MKIPDLEADVDISEGWVEDSAGNEQQVASSNWLNEQSEEFKNKFEKQIERLIQHFNLPNSFFGWIRDYLLYGEPPYKPLYDSEYKIDEKEIGRLGLTTKEKKILKNEIRKKLNLPAQGRLKKDEIKKLQSIFKLIDNAPSPKRRQYKTLSSALKTFDKHHKKDKHFDPALGEDDSGSDIIEKKTINQIVSEIFPNEDGSRDKQLSQKLRKQKERLKKRLNNPNKKTKK